jgi:hypothetical protein
MKKTIWFVVGAIIGVFLVRELYFNPVNHLAWDMFWEGIMEQRKVDYQSIDYSVLFSSQTFLITSAGFFMGGAVGVAFEHLLIVIDRFTDEKK